MIVSGTDWKFAVRKIFAGNQVLVKQIFLWVLSAFHKNHACVVRTTTNHWKEILKHCGSNCMFSSKISSPPVCAMGLHLAAFSDAQEDYFTPTETIFLPFKNIPWQSEVREIVLLLKQCGKWREVDKPMQGVSRVWFPCWAPAWKIRSRSETNSLQCFCLPTVF